MYVPIGKLDRRVTIQSQTTTQDAAGQPTNVWTDVWACWAGIQVVIGKEVYDAGGYISEVTHTVTIRYPSVAITSAMRVLYKNKKFTIKTVSDFDEGRKQLNLLCRELND